MLTAPFKIVLDANVLFPFSLRDILLRSAADDLFQLYWSQQILDEMERNLVAKATITRAQATRLRTKMEGAFPEAMVTGHEHLIDAMPNHEKDRHVVAVAVKIGAEVIVTSNLKDFRALPDGIEAQHPDEFLCDLFDLDPEHMVMLVKSQAAALRRPPRSFDQLLHGLAKMVPDFARSVAQHIGGPSGSM